MRTVESVLEENPWKNFSEGSPRVLPADQPTFERLNSRYKAGHPFHLQEFLYPEPFVGNLKEARVICLLSNPGFNDGDIEALKDPTFRNAIISNLKQSIGCGFFPLNKNFDDAPASDYWTKRLRELTQEVGIEALEKHFAVLEYHPYHSQKFGGGGLLKKSPFPSSRFVFNLVEHYIRDPSKVIIVMRSSTLWAASCPSLKKSLATITRNPRCTYLSRKALGAEAFGLVASALAGQ